MSRKDAQDLMAECSSRGVRIERDAAGDLRWTAPRGVISAELLERIQRLKRDLLALLAPPAKAEIRGHYLYCPDGTVYRQLPGGRGWQLFEHADFEMVEPGTIDFSRPKGTGGVRVIAGKGAS